MKSRMAVVVVAMSLAVMGIVQAQQARANAIVELLKQGKVAFGSMVPDKSEAGAAKMAQDPNLDFVFYDMERTYDLAGLKTFMGAFHKGSRKSLLVRIPPIGTEPDKAASRVAEILDAGADGIVFPHIMNRQQAELAVELLGKSKRGLWPQKTNGEVVGYFMIEDREAVEHAKEIIGTKGATMFAPGQGSLGQSYNGDAQAVETAVQSILATCKSLKVTCAKLASDADIEKRINEGFRVLLATGDALVKGRKLAGR